MIADNFYWVAKDAESYRALDKLASASVNSDVKAASDATVDGGREKVWRVHLRNTGSDAAIALKLTLRHADGTRILPAYYSDNYLSLLPGEERTVTIQAPVERRRRRQRPCFPARLEFFRAERAAGYCGTCTEHPGRRRSRAFAPQRDPRIGARQMKAKLFQARRAGKQNEDLRRTKQCQTRNSKI